LREDVLQQPARELGAYERREIEARIRGSGENGAGSSSSARRRRRRRRRRRKARQIRTRVLSLYLRPPSTSCWLPCLFPRHTLNIPRFDPASR
jgi:hypothetical protein